MDSESLLRGMSLFAKKSTSEGNDAVSNTSEGGFKRSSRA